MVRRRKSDALRTIKQRADAGAIELTYHALLEMIDDNLSEDDIKSAIKHGKLIRRQSSGARGRKYVLRGPATDGRLIGAVCRPVQDIVRIITVYHVESCG